MKRLISLLLIFIVVAIQQSSAKISLVQVKDTLTDSTYEQLYVHNNFSVYKLFPTKNIWTFIKLNTRNGEMTIVQFSVGDSNRFEYYLNSAIISSNEEVTGRFTLYPTENIYNFLLLDQISGQVYQVQWSTKSEQRFVIPIEHI